MVGTLLRQREEIFEKLANGTWQIAIGQGKVKTPSPWDTPGMNRATALDS
jgi:hypothetical protein